MVRRRRHYQHGGFIPLLLMAGKAIATAAAKKGLSYGAKSAWNAARRKKRVGKISWAQAQANQRLVRNMRNRMLDIAGLK